MQSKMQLKREYKEVNSISNAKKREQTFKLGNFFMNVNKNRYFNILPPDHTCVRLGRNPQNYINANFIYKKTYIATQAPIKSLRADTMVDFWIMVWQQDATQIFMLTRFKEGQKCKAECYWPVNLLESKTFGEITVLFSEEKVLYPNILVERTFLITKGDSVSKKVTHYHYMGWSDFGVPKKENIEIFKNLLELVNIKNISIIHCSAGIGRTGTFIACHISMMKMKSNEKINIRDIVTNLRVDRTGMVQTFSQYKFIHEFIKTINS